MEPVHRKTTHKSDGFLWNECFVSHASADGKQSKGKEHSFFIVEEHPHPVAVIEDVHVVEAWSRAVLQTKSVSGPHRKSDGWVNVYLGTSPQIFSCEKQTASRFSHTPDATASIPALDRQIDSLHVKLDKARAAKRTDEREQIVREIRELEAKSVELMRQKVESTTRVVPLGGGPSFLESLKSLLSTPPK